MDQPLDKKPQSQRHSPGTVYPLGCEDEQLVEERQARIDQTARAILAAWCAMGNISPFAALPAVANNCTVAYQQALELEYARERLLALRGAAT